MGKILLTRMGQKLAKHATARMILTVMTDDDTLCEDGDEPLKLKGSCSFGLREATL